MLIRFRSSKLAILVAASLLSACTVGPDFHAPDAPKLTSYTAKPLPQATASAPVALGAAQTYNSGLAVNAYWWKNFGSDKLNTLIDKALRASPSMAAARATLEQAQQTYLAQSGSTRFPKADLNLGAQREVVNNAMFGQNGSSNAFNLFNANISVSYLFDVFGGNRRNLEAFAAQADYAHYQLQAAQLTMAGNIATAAMTEAQLSAQIDASQRILAIQQEQFDIAQRRQALGALALSDVLALKTQLEQTRAGIPALTVHLQQTRHLLATLSGQMPASDDVPDFTLSDFSLPENLPLVVPSQLVRVRPDIQAAEALLHVANAQYGVAISTTYPQISLSATLGQEALTPGTLFSPNAAFWSLAGQIAQPLFNGWLKAGVKAAKANLAIVDADYRQTVLQAFRNVADALRALDDDAQVLAAQAAADQAAQTALGLVTQQFKLGSANYMQLLTAQQQAQQTRINFIAAQTQRLTDTAALYQAMGGNWPADANSSPLATAPTK